MPIRCESFRPRRTAVLRGFCDLLLTETHLKIFDVGLFEKDGRRWASLPSKPKINREGHVIRGKDDKIEYAPVMAFASREASDQFSKAAINAVLAEHPDVFDGDGGAA